MRTPKAAPDSLLASVLLAFLGTAGLYYVNIMPALIQGLQTGAHFSARDAGLAGSANVYGAAAGALLAAGLVMRWSWRQAAVSLLVAIILIDLGSIFVHSPAAMIAVRALHGLAGGALVGFSFSVIARTRRPERTFGMLLIVQDGLGGLGVAFLPQLVPVLGTKALFYALMAFSTITLFMLPFLSDYPRSTGLRAPSAANAEPRTRWGPLTMALLAVFLFQFSNMLLFAYILGLATYFSLDAHTAEGIVGVSTWIGIVGSILVIVLANRCGYRRTLLVALSLTAGGMLVLHRSASIAMYVIANCGTAITWSFTIPYLLGMCARFDTTGRAAAFAGFASKLGLATGPLMGALLLNGVRFDLIIDVASIGIGGCALAALWPAALLDRGRI